MSSNAISLDSAKIAALVETQTKLQQDVASLSDDVNRKFDAILAYLQTEEGKSSAHREEFKDADHVSRLKFDGGSNSSSSHSSSYHHVPLHQMPQSQGTASRLYPSESQRNPYTKLNARDSPVGEFPELHQQQFVSHSAPPTSKNAHFATSLIDSPVFEGAPSNAGATTPTAPAAAGATPAAPALVIPAPSEKKRPTPSEVAAAAAAKGYAPVRAVSKGASAAVSNAAAAAAAPAPNAAAAAAAAPSPVQLASLPKRIFSFARGAQVGIDDGKDKEFLDDEEEEEGINNHLHLHQQYPRSGTASAVTSNNTTASATSASSSSAASGVGATSYLSGNREGILAPSASTSVDPFKGPFPYQSQPSPLKVKPTFETKNNN
jgi:hypothetical protein